MMMTTRSSTKTPTRTATAPGNNKRVRLTAAGKTYQGESGTVTALAPTDLTIEPGEFVCVVGPSGCGKTTMLRMLAGFEEPSEGAISMGIDRIDRPSPDRGVVFQSANLYPWLTVRGNVEFGLRSRGMGKEERRRKATDMLDMVGLGGFGDRKPYELSGGMQQRAQIARVLVCDPSIILMDEPFGALDPFTREKLQVELLRIWSAQKKTVMFITHSVEEAVFLSTRVLVMSARPGRVILDQKVALPGDGGAAGVRDLSVMSTPEFQELKETLSAAIVSAHD